FEDIDLDDLPLDELIQSEIVTWFRYNLNHNKHNEIGEPKYIIPESNRWNDIIGSNVQIRLPAEDFVMTLPELFNFLNGTGPIDNIKAEFKFFGQTAKITLPTGFIPPTGDPILEGLEGVSIDQIQTPDFENDIPNVRFWVCGNDSADQANTGKTVGNYWGSSDVFPIDHLTHKTKMFLHADGSLDFNTPTKNEGFLTYVHDPDDPVMTVGGGNMLVNTPQGDRRSQGPMNYADPNFSTFTMKRPGVLSFETESISDSLSIIGYPIATIMAKSNPAGTFDGPTDTDFFVRILDVYPDGREFFVVEGGVNARARDYARSLAHNNPNDNAPISNITSGTLYEYRFRLMPIAHTFGEGHKMKVLISSSNHPRYQSNPNLPIEDGDFFRRYPNDGQGYFYDGQLMYPRVAVQRIAFSNDYGVNSTNIEFPFHVHPWIFTGNEPTRDINVDFDASVFPNPAVDHASILLNRPSKCELIVRDVLGKVLHQDVFQDSYQLDLSSYQNQTYFIQIVDLKTREAIHKKLIVQ
ncbi:MAG: CocE/NonD family hydrolase, partial [Flavobacteriales bacterium]|nr:CocE/NonD family hydrolase [Flavobacteriales bacterium]